MWCIHTAAALEQRGIPTVTVCTEPFMGLAETQRKGLRMPDLPLVTVPHPNVGRSSEALLEVARMHADAVLRALAPALVEARVVTRLTRRG